MFQKTILINSLIYFIVFICSGCKKLPPIKKLVYQDSLSLNVSFYQNKVDKFFTSKASQPLEILWLSSAKSWIAYSYYTLENETHLRAIGLKEDSTWTSPDPYIQNIGNLSNLKFLSLSTIGMKQLPKSITKLNNLEDLNISFNDNLNWDDVIPTLKKLPNLKVIRAYGMNVDHKIYQKLKNIKDNLKIRYTLNHFNEDMRKWFDYDEYTPSN